MIEMMNEKIIDELILNAKGIIKNIEYLFGIEKRDQEVKEIVDYINKQLCYEYQHKGMPLYLLQYGMDEVKKFQSSYERIIVIESEYNDKTVGELLDDYPYLLSTELDAIQPMRVENGKIFIDLKRL